MVAAPALRLTLVAVVVAVGVLVSGRVLVVAGLVVAGLVVEQSVVSGRRGR